MANNYIVNGWTHFRTLLLAVFSPEEEVKHRWLTILWIASLILAGIILWCVFFNWGNVPIDYMDWAEVWAARLQAWRDALLHNTIPFHLNDLGAMRTENDRYFAVADMVSSPQVILLRWLEVGPYSLINNLLLFGFATGSLLHIRKKYRLSLFAFACVFMLFHFNGFIVTHLSVGHLSWGGYYLFPAFVLLLLDMLDGVKTWRWVASMSLVLFFMLLQGSFHHFIWCALTLFVIALVRARYFLQILKAGTFAVLLSLPRLLPVFIERAATINGGIDFLGGYPSLINVVNAITYNSTPDMGLPRLVFDSSLGYWEFDAFIGKPGLLFVGGFGIALLAYLHVRRRELPIIVIPAVVLTTLSISDHFMKVFAFIPLLVTSERVSSRMFGLVLVIVIILAIIHYQQVAARFSHHWALQLLQLVLLAAIIRDLALHTLRWSVTNASVAFSAVERNLSTIRISNHSDPQYYLAMGIGAVVSVCSMAFLGWIVRREKNDLLLNTRGLTRTDPGLPQ